MVISSIDDCKRGAYQPCSQSQDSFIDDFLTVSSIHQRYARILMSLSFMHRTYYDICWFFHLLFDSIHSLTNEKKPAANHTVRPRDCYSQAKHITRATMSAMPMIHEDYTVAWICALPQPPEPCSIRSIPGCHNPQAMTTHIRWERFPVIISSSPACHRECMAPFLLLL